MVKLFDLTRQLIFYKLMFTCCGFLRDCIKNKKSGRKQKMPIKVKVVRSRTHKIKVQIEHPFWLSYQVY